MEDEDQMIGIMGGTFDPIHNGHLVTAECARHQYDLDKVVFVPSGNPPHKTDKKITSAEDRYSMALLATMSNPHFRVSRIEIDRQGLSYTIDTVRAFKEMYPGAKIYFITGADAILEIFTWKAPDVLLEEVEFIAASRPGYCLSQLGKEIYDEYRDSINLLEIPGLAISSTNIRTRVKHGRPIKYQLPEEVEAYIRKHNLYVYKKEE
ncbi:nicotinate-nucleotide adenylyltransferase [Halanaerobacter jeridensis]|uniref:Probable nicotinate-nucleotide adenylyltransferase n=1 Tax=Halanaerobacter jeridensis TaxID=706427 RepID=A0A938XTV0_9FIRM|nr:nicotinate-nucleotide adenylyltransferase [Halanaerobacter jeridensis]MBM7556211.1 nicotinate-nucleotide adenylyltransferase [Halanaerobacter jeridensis]